MERRLPELFGEKDFSKEYNSAGSFPKQLLKQDRDWTCAFACVRTILSGLVSNVPDEEYLIKKHQLSPGPYYATDLKEMGIFDQYSKNVIYSADLDPNTIDLKILQQLLQDGHFIMAECAYNISHWVVILGYCVVQDPYNTDKHSVLIYDPYYDVVKLLIADEFGLMWQDAPGHYREFIAIK